MKNKREVENKMEDMKSNQRWAEGKGKKESVIWLRGYLEALSWVKQGE